MYGNESRSGRELPAMLGAVTPNWVAEHAVLVSLVGLHAVESFSLRRLEGRGTWFYPTSAGAQGRFGTCHVVL